MDKNIIVELQKIIGKDGVLSTPEDLAVYSYDGTFAEHRPDVVVLPRTTEQVSQVVIAGGTRTHPGGHTRDGIRAGGCVGAVLRGDHTYP